MIPNDGYDGLTDDNKECAHKSIIGYENKDINMKAAVAARGIVSNLCLVVLVWLHSLHPDNMSNRRMIVLIMVMLFVILSVLWLSSKDNSPLNKPDGFYPSPLYNR